MTRCGEPEPTIVLENPLLFAHWLQRERQVIGEDVDVDTLWAQYEDARGCNHDPAALTDAEILRCECGALGVTDSQYCDACGSTPCKAGSEPYACL